MKDKQSVRGWLKGYNQEVLIVRQVFTNKDGSTGILNLVCSETTLTGEQVSDIYKKRWKVEEFHKSLENLLKNLNTELSVAKKNILPDSLATMNKPVILVMGAMRSGTTLFMQWLANTVLVAYPTNFLSRFYQS